MKTNISTYISATLLALLVLSSCSKDFLDRKPLGQLTEEDLPAGSLEGQVLAIYAGLRSEGTSGLPYVGVHNMRSDDAEIGSSVGDEAGSAPNTDDFQYTTNFWLWGNYWTDHYKLIALTNTAIETADSLGNQSPEVARGLAEAKFFRAWAYFNLVRAFGEVPKIDFRVRDQKESILPKSPIADIYALIDSDLEYATQHLPLNWESRFIGRITQGAAFAVQAKTFLARQQYSKALAASRMVINSGQYNLGVAYNQIFRESSENSKESVFEIQAYYAQGQTNLGITYAGRQGVRGSGAMNLGWGWNVPNERLAKAFEEGDPRKDETLLYAGRVNTPYGELIPAATATVPRAYWNKKVYTDPKIRTTTGSQAGEWFNFRVIRYADVVLMAAEAANEVGEQEAALTYLEQIRVRARGGNNAILPKVTTTNQQELRLAIRHERQVELGMENERFFDLIRWNIDAETFKDAGKTNYQLRNRYLPIPQNEIDRSGGVLIQNPNY